MGDRVCVLLRCRDYTLRRFIYLSGAATETDGKPSVAVVDRRRDNMIKVRRHKAHYYILCGVIVLPLSYKLCLSGYP